MEHPGVKNMTFWTAPSKRISAQGKLRENTSQPKKFYIFSVNERDLGSMTSQAKLYFH